ncbi:MAG TPA: hypothetical protein DCE56_34290 [Cyanobacteria bacterium UBA8553]|nr:hypothetical protein [Cyanobacteria bacterium UBA8553]
MAWIFSLSAECGLTQEAADSFAKHFNEISWMSLGEEGWKCSTQVFQDDESNWWCMVCPSGISEIGVISPEDAHQMTEVGLLLYGCLRSAPAFRYALVGVEVDEFRTYSELVTADGQPDILVAGLVLAEDVWKYMGSPVGFRSFNPGYLWKPYEGEVYSPLRVSSQLREKLNELVVGY